MKQDNSAPSTKTATFKADSALLQELGERLVGKAHIALAELVKNAYDADATHCLIRIREDEIEVQDNGNGMTEDEFLSYWMTIGTRQKERDKWRSRTLKRNVTGSKGVGRLAVQFLAHELELMSTARSDVDSQLVANVNWDETVRTRELTDSKVEYRLETRSKGFVGRSQHGTRVILRNLKQVWNETATRDLGRELWMIQSPFSRNRIVDALQGDPSDFQVKLKSSFAEAEVAFKDQMKAALENHIALIKGEIRRSNNKGEAYIRVDFRDGNQYSERFDVNPLISNVNWEIRVFHLSGRQGGGISVQDARDYFAKFGGVRIYDTGFRLPYYGVDQDWLGIEFDHSHRKNRSALLPERLQVRRALNDLPTQGRIFGVVHLDTGVEARNATEQQRDSGEFLKIQVTRDRLVANDAYEELKRGVRWSLDYYATRKRLHDSKLTARRRPERRIADVLKAVHVLVNQAQEEHPQDETLNALAREYDDLSKTIVQERAVEEALIALLGPLASAGMAALALVHETHREIKRAQILSRSLDRTVGRIDDEDLKELSGHIEAWVDRAQGSRRLLGPLIEVDDREEVDTFSAARVLEEVVESTTPLLAGMPLTVAVPRELYLPAATFAEWSALFQNILVNAANATLDTENRSASCIGGRTGRSCWVRIRDNGSGVDPSNAEQLFAPFVRKIEISEERRSLGLGGSGLGLTIVKMIANQRNARVAFVEPSAPWKTDFRLSWSSTQ